MSTAPESDHLREGQHAQPCKKYLKRVLWRARCSRKHKVEHADSNAKEQHSTNNYLPVGDVSRSVKAHMHE